MPSGRCKAIDVLGGHLEVFGQQADQVLGHVGVHLQADGRTKVALAQALLDRLQQVRGLVLLDFHVGIARDAESVGLHHVKAREKRAQVADDHVLEPDKAAARFERHQAWQAM